MMYQVGPLPFSLIHSVNSCLKIHYVIGLKYLHARSSYSIRHWHLQTLPGRWAHKSTTLPPWTALQRLVCPLSKDPSEKILLKYACFMRIKNLLGNRKEWETAEKRERWGFQLVSMHCTMPKLRSSLSPMSLCTRTQAKRRLPPIQSLNCRGVSKFRDFSVIFLLPQISLAIMMFQMPMPSMYCRLPRTINAMLKRHWLLMYLGCKSYKCPLTMPEMLALALYAKNLVRV